MKTNDKTANCQSSIADRFTLIELLIVIAIISILAAMLLPALNKARSYAKSTFCTSNLRQCNLSLFSYSNDFNHWYPNGMNTVNYYMNWSWYLQQCGYTKIGDVYRCPNNLKVNSSYYNTYGFRSFGFFNSKAWVTRTPENTFILVDSLESKTQIAAIYSASSPGDEKYINLRHNRLANVSYMDGHAEPVGMKGLSKIGISAFHINQDY